METGRILSRGNKRGQKTKKALILAAEKAMMRYGFKNATLELIAKEAGVHTQTLYRHFPNKNALMEAISEDEISVVERGLFDSTRDKSVIEWWYEVKVKNVNKLQVDGVRNWVALMLELEQSGQHTHGHYEIEDLLVEAFAEEMGVDKNSPEPQNMATLLYWSTIRFFRKASKKERMTDKKLVKEFRQVIDGIEDIYGRLLVRTRVSRQ